MSYLFYFLVTLALAAPLIAVGLVIERRWPARTDQSFEGILFDIKCALLNISAAWLLAPFTGVAAVFLINRAGGGFVHLRSDGWWFGASLAAYLLSRDLLDYFVHRAQHRIPILWAMHSLHHSDETFNVSTGWRHFWLVSMLKVVAVYPLLGIVFDAPLAILNTAAALYLLNHAWAHLNIRHSLGRWTLWVMNPQYHRLHHSVEREHWNCNFADLFPVIDVIFGTACLPRSDEYPATGLAPSDRPATLIDAILWPLRSGPELSRRRTPLVAGAASGTPR